MFNVVNATILELRRMEGFWMEAEFNIEMEIDDGPSQWTTMLYLFEHRGLTSPYGRNDCKFTLLDRNKSKHEFRVLSITSVKRIDFLGGGSIWIIKGYLFNVVNVGGAFEATFSFRTRKGGMKTVLQ